MIGKVKEFKRLNPYWLYTTEIYPRGLEVFKMVPDLEALVPANSASLQKLICLPKKRDLNRVHFLPPFTSVCYFLKDNLRSC